MKLRRGTLVLAAMLLGVVVAFNALAAAAARAATVGVTGVLIRAIPAVTVGTLQVAVTSYRDSAPACS